jgi:Rps23 Pro-64 3,4-dihydroxylase Tpa1-like proline 4-hydroxylase
MNFNVSTDTYASTQPFPYVYQDNFIENASDIQEEILNIPDSAWDRYDNPFEQKYTLRDKYAFPPLLNQLFEKFESPEFVKHLSEVCGHRLVCDPTRNFWGVHKYKTGDKLDIHVDAGLHPTTKQKKQLTFGLYLSANWKEEYGCQLEVWRGDNAGTDVPRLHEKVTSIAPNFNRAVIFTCNDYAWHGNPVSAECPPDASRIFVTISYLSENQSDTNKRVKALFVARPGDPHDEEKDKLRRLRADPEKYKDVYRFN